MAQTTRSSSTRSRRTGSSTSRSTGRDGSSRSTRARSATKRPRNARSRNGSSKVAELASKAKPPVEKVPQTVRKTGGKVTDVASKAKTPLIAGGAALAGLAGGVALKSRTENRRPVKNLRSRSLPRSLKNIDLETITSAARRMRSIGEQVGDLADAADKTRKKHN
jgi:hypothetical protein